LSQDVDDLMLQKNVDLLHPAAGDSQPTICIQHCGCATKTQKVNKHAEERGWKAAMNQLKNVAPEK